MVLIKYFCFYFPVRLGVIICSVLACTQSLCSLGYCLLNDTDHFKMVISDLQENIEEYSSNQVFDKFLELAEKNTAKFRLAVLVFCGSFAIACLLNIIAALKLWRWLLVPYIVIDFIRLCGFFAAHVIIMMIFKKQLNLGILIVACSFGGFFILLLGYMWNCSVALFQIIGIVKSASYQKILSLELPAPPKVSQRNVLISTINVNRKPTKSDLKMDKAAEAGMFASDFSEYYQRSPHFRM